MDSLENSESFNNNDGRRFSEGDSCNFETESNFTPSKSKNNSQNIFSNIKHLTRTVQVPKSESRIPRLIKADQDIVSNYFRYTSKSELKGFYSRHCNLISNSEQSTKYDKTPSNTHDINNITGSNTKKDSYQTTEKFTDKNNTSTSHTNEKRTPKLGTQVSKPSIKNDRDNNELFQSIETPARQNHTDTVDTQPISILNTSLSNISINPNGSILNASFCSSASSHCRVHWSDSKSPSSYNKRRKLNSPLPAGIPADTSDLNLRFVEKVLSKSSESIKVTDLTTTKGDLDHIAEIGSSAANQPESTSPSPTKSFPPDLSLYSPKMDRSQLFLIDQKSELDHNEYDLSLDLISNSAYKTPRHVNFVMDSTRSTQPRISSVSNLFNSAGTNPAKSPSIHGSFQRHSTPPPAEPRSSHYTSPLLRFSTVRNNVPKLSDNLVLDPARTNGGSHPVTPNKLRSLFDTDNSSNPRKSSSKSSNDLGLDHFQSPNRFNLPFNGLTKQLSRSEEEHIAQVDIQLSDLSPIKPSDPHDPLDFEGSEVAYQSEELELTKNKLQTLEHQHEALNRKCQNQDIQLRKGEENASRLSKEIRLLKSQLSDCQKKVKTIQQTSQAEKYLQGAEIQMIKEDRDQCKVQLKELELSNSTLTKTNQDQLDYIEKCQDVVKELQTLVNTLKSDVAISEQRFDKLKEHAQKKLKHASDNTKQHHEQYTKELKSSKLIQEKQKELIQQLQNDLKSKMVENEELINLSDQLIEKIQHYE